MIVLILTIDFDVERKIKKSGQKINKLTNYKNRVFLIALNLIYSYPIKFRGTFYPIVITGL